MPTQKAIIEQWFARSLEVYAAEAGGFLATEKDPFRNPVGHTLRESLTTLLHELLGQMDMACVQSALEDLLRIRAVQDLTASQAVGFVFLLRPILREQATGLEPAVLNDRIDQLALMAFEEYTRRREQVAELRVAESRRALQRPSALSRPRS